MPEHELAHYQLGVAYRELGRLDDAVRCWQDALKVSPNSADAHAALAEVLARQSRLSAAEKHALNAVRLEPRSPDAHHALGVVRDRQGRAREALVCFREAVRLNPHALAPRLHLADTLRRAGQPDGAEEELCALRRLYPNWSPPDTGSR
jgi:Flp pilus assembly protein TadD